jgi:vancomycin permeability regulator SanA
VSGQTSAIRGGARAAGVAASSRRLVTLPRVLAVAALGGVVLALVLLGPAAWVFWRTQGLRYDDPTSVPPQQTAIVFGAGLKTDGTPSPLLSDRVHAAVLLYLHGKVKRLLMSGDGGTPGHNEPAAMAHQAEAEGVPATAILQDPGGIHTYASCRRAHDLFGVSSAVVVSQSYHLPRAIYTCRRLGVRSVGFSLARTPYGGDPSLRARELVSLDVAWWTLLADKGP